MKTAVMVLALVGCGGDAGQSGAVDLSPAPTVVAVGAPAPLASDAAVQSDLGTAVDLDPVPLDLAHATADLAASADLSLPADLSRVDLLPAPDLMPPCGAHSQACCTGYTCTDGSRCMVGATAVPPGSGILDIRCLTLSSCGGWGLQSCGWGGNTWCARDMYSPGDGNTSGWLHNNPCKP